MSSQFSGCKVVITGASDGMGKEAVAVFARSGAQVLAVGRNADKLDAAVQGLSSAATLALDLADAGAPRRIVDDAVRSLGGIDILVSCAGAFDMAPVDQTDRDLLERMMAVNFYAPAMLSVLSIPHLKASGRGRIIVVGSVATRYTDRAMGAYVASKCAMEGFTKNLALELGMFGITTNMIAPGMVRTGMTGAMLEDPAVLHHFTARVPAGRVGTVGDIASTISFLASVDAGFCNRTTIPLDGGYTVGSYGSEWGS